MVTRSFKIDSQFINVRILISNTFRDTEFKMWDLMHKDPSRAFTPNTFWKHFCYRD